MTFSLYVDSQRWRAHQRGVLAEFPGLVPVAKGNGYGVGLERLAAESAALGVGTVAVGLHREAADVQAAFPGDVLVLTPVKPATTYDDNDRVIHTVAQVEHLETLPPNTRVVVECRTSMNRHGVRPADLPALAAGLTRMRHEGFALHHPLDRSHVDPCAETVTWLEQLHAAGLPTATIWVSHLSGPETGELAARFPATAWRPRIGTRLWLGDRDALTARGTVLDVEPLERGQRSGYRQHAAPSRGHLVVVSGGTAHGVALEAPKPVRGLVSRARVLALGTMQAAGRNLSPFVWAGKHRWFLEPPHMQVSLVFVPHQVAPPAVGAELECRMRLTTTHPDRVVTV